MQRSPLATGRLNGGGLASLVRPLFVVFFIFGCVSVAQSEARTDHQAEVWATSCLTCHSVPKSHEKASIPSLYGMPAAHIENQMKSYAIAEKPGELMHQLAKGYDEQTMHRIALWFQNTPEPKP